MKRIICAVILSLACFSVSRANAVELSVSPGLGYSSYYGFEYSLGVAADFSLDEHWQLGASALGLQSDYSSVSRTEVRFGPTYNFSTDLERSLFLKFGAGYSDHYPDPLDSPSGFGFAEFGKRFLLSKKYHITYRPAIGINVDGHSTRVELPLLNFSIFF